MGTGRGEATPEVLRVRESSPSSAESSFRELDDVFLQNQTRIWLGEVLQIRFDEKMAVADLLADGEVLLQASKEVWNMVSTKYVEAKYSKALVYERHMPGNLRGKYMPYLNVDKFLKVCQILGLTGIDLFSPSDVVEKRDIRRVCMCVRALSKKARSKLLDVPDFDLVNYTIAMPTDMVGGIRRNLEQAQCSSSSSLGYAPSMGSIRKYIQRGDIAHQFDLFEELDEVESNFRPSEFGSPFSIPGYDDFLDFISRRSSGGNSMMDDNFDMTEDIFYLDGLNKSNSQYIDSFDVSSTVYDDHQFASLHPVKTPQSCVKYQIHPNERKAYSTCTPQFCEKNSYPAPESWETCTNSEGYSSSEVNEHCGFNSKDASEDETSICSVPSHENVQSTFMSLECLHKDSTSESGNEIGDHDIYNEVNLPVVKVLKLKEMDAKALESRVYVNAIVDDESVKPLLLKVLTTLDEKPQNLTGLKGCSSTVKNTKSVDENSGNTLESLAVVEEGTVPNGFLGQDCSNLVDLTSSSASVFTSCKEKENNSSPDASNGYVSHEASDLCRFSEDAHGSRMCSNLIGAIELEPEFKAAGSLTAAMMDVDLYTDIHFKNIYVENACSPSARSTCGLELFTDLSPGDLPEQENRQIMQNVFIDDPAPSDGTGENSVLGLEAGMGFQSNLLGLCSDNQIANNVVSDIENEDTLEIGVCSERACLPTSGNQPFQGTSYTDGNGQKNICRNSQGSLFRKRVYQPDLSDDLTGQEYTQKGLNVLVEKSMLYADGYADNSKSDLSIEIRFPANFVEDCSDDKMSGSGNSCANNEDFVKMGASTDQQVNAVSSPQNMNKATDNPRITGSDANKVETKLNKRQVLKSVAGGVTIFGVLFFLFHFSRRTEDRDLYVKKTEGKAKVRKSVLHQRKSIQEGLQKSKAAAVYPGERLKFKG